MRRRLLALAVLATAAVALTVVAPVAHTPAAPADASVVSAGTGRLLTRGTARPGVAARVEPLRTIEVTTPPPNLPAIENTLFSGGASGLELVTVGALSGEVVARRTVRAAVPVVPEHRRLVALTFDDGPDPHWTPQFLAVLRAAHVRATFCVVGSQAARFPELVRAIADAGHVVCNHTQRHLQHLNRQAPGRVRAEIDRAQLAITAAGVAPPLLFRAPEGSLSPVIVDLARAAGLRVLDWDTDPDDWQRPPATTLVARVLAARHPGAVIVLHDGGGDRSQTLAALPHIIAGLQHRGYSFATP
ncbi:MAG: polysaccharide deacetylase family protein [Mycobacteriales bacterium]|nr:polysaccharide deacetylase family protein [Frankia sp.]